MSIANKNQKLVAVNNSNSKTNKLKVIIILIISIFPVTLISCEKKQSKTQIKEVVESSSKDTLDFAIRFRLKDPIESYNYFKENLSSKTEFIGATKEMAIAVIDTDFQLGRSIWDIIGDWDAPEYFIQMPHEGVQVSRDILVYPIVLTWPEDPRPENIDNRSFIFTDRIKDVWLVEYCYKGKNFFYIYTDTIKNNPRTIVEFSYNQDKSSIYLTNVLVRKGVPEQEVDRSGIYKK